MPRRKTLCPLAALALPLRPARVGVSREQSPVPRGLWRPLLALSVSSGFPCCGLCQRFVLSAGEEVSSWSWATPCPPSRQRTGARARPPLPMTHSDAGVLCARDSVLQSPPPRRTRGHDRSVFHSHCVRSRGAVSCPAAVPAGPSSAPPHQLLGCSFHSSRPAAVSICVSLMSSDEHLFACLLAIRVSDLEK